MLASIQLDDQPGLRAHEVDNVSADRHLSSKTEPLKLPSTQMSPKMALCIGRPIAQVAGAAAQ